MKTEPLKDRLERQLADAQREVKRVEELLKLLEDCPNIERFLELHG